MSQFRLALLLITVGTCLAATQDFQDKLVSTLLSQFVVRLQLYTSCTCMSQHMPKYEFSKIKAYLLHQHFIDTNVLVANNIYMHKTPVAMTTHFGYRGKFYSRFY